MNVVWHHTVRKSGKHFEVAAFLNLLNRRSCDGWRLEDGPSLFVLKHNE
jgi:hypothetical protein